MKSARFTLNMEPADLDLLRRIAKRANRKPSEYIRLIVENEIERERRFSLPSAHVDNTQEQTQTHAEAAS